MPVQSDAELVAALRRGDDAVFAALVDEWSPAMLKVARMYVPSHAVAEEVVQETWIAVLHGIDRFEGRSSLRGWVFSILMNKARTLGKRERRTLPFAALGERWAEMRGASAVDEDRFQGRRGERPGWWASPPVEWTDPHARLETAEGLALLREEIAALPPRQRDAVVLRDVLGLSAEEAGMALGVSEGNQRVLLHRGREKVRAALERRLGGARATASEAPA